MNRSPLMRPVPHHASRSGPLGRFPYLCTTDQEEFVAGLNTVYGSSQVTAARPVRGQVHELRAVTGSGFAIGYVRSGMGVRITPRDQDGPCYLNLAISGSVRSSTGDQELVNDLRTAAVLSAGTPQVLTPDASGSETIGVKIERELVDAELAALLGHEPDQPVRFALGLDLTSPAGRGLDSLVRTLLSEADRPSGGLFDQPAVRQHYIRTLIAALLTTHRHNYSEALRSPSAPLRPRSLRRALEYIEGHLGEPITVGAIAAAAGCSTRTLHEYFHEHVGSTPMEHVKELRLRRVHQELLRTDRPVTEVAYEWGFTHLGRFSSSYRRRFGVLPSRTARGA